MLGVLLFGLGSGLNRGWIEFRWGRMMRDLGFPFVCDPEEPSKCYPRGSPYIEKQAK